MGTAIPMILNYDRVSLPLGCVFADEAFQLFSCAKFNSDKTDLAKAKTVHLTKWILPADTKYIYTRSLGVPLGPNSHLIECLKRKGI